MLVLVCKTFFFSFFGPTTFDIILIDQSNYVTVEDEGADADAEMVSPTTEGPPPSLFFFKFFFV